MVRYFSNWHLFVSLFCSIVRNVFQFKFSPCYINHREPNMPLYSPWPCFYSGPRKTSPSSWGANDRFDSWVRGACQLVDNGVVRGWERVIVTDCPQPKGPWLASCGPRCGKYYHRDFATGSTAMPRRWQTADPIPFLNNNLPLKANTSLIKPPAPSILFTFNLWLHWKSYQYLFSSWKQFKHVYQTILRSLRKMAWHYQWQYGTQ